MNDWRIVLYPRDPRIPAELTAGGDTLELLPELCDEADAVEALEDWAATFQRYGRIPPSMDFQSLSPIAVIRRTGRRRFLCRADCFEFETQTGRSNGYCWLVAEDRPSDPPGRSPTD